jgi:hypothetical protein
LDIGDAHLFAFHDLTSCPTARDLLDEAGELLEQVIDFGVQSVNLAFEVFGNRLARPNHIRLVLEVEADRLAHEVGTTGRFSLTTARAV